MTPTSLSVVVVGDVDTPAGSGHDAFEVPVGGADARAATARATSVVEAIAVSRGRRLTSIGITWSDAADAEASLLMESLAESGFDNVVAIRLPEATEALARGLADVIGYRTSAVCLIEPDTAIALVVHTDDGAVQTAINQNIDSDESLIGWLSAVFTRADWQPEALVVVGSAGGFDAVLPRLEEALSVPVFAPAEAPLALARGAALASTRDSGLPLDPGALTGMPATAGRVADGGVASSRVLAGLVVAGLVTFVVSASVAFAAGFSPPEQAAAPEPPAAERVSEDALPSRGRAAALPPPPAEAPAPVIAEPVEALAPVLDWVPPPEVEPVMDTAPAEAPVELLPEAPAPAPRPGVAPIPRQVYVAPPRGYVEPQKPLLQRIRDKLRIGGDDQPPAIIMNPPMG